MPQGNYLSMFQASYPILAPPQKPGGVTVLTTATPPRVPNKPTYAAGTIQIAQAEAPVVEEKTMAEQPAEEEVEEDDGNGGTVRRTRRTPRRRR